MFAEKIRKRSYRTTIRQISHHGHGKSCDATERFPDGVQIEECLRGMLTSPSRHLSQEPWKNAGHVRRHLPYDSEEQSRHNKRWSHELNLELSPFALDENWRAFSVLTTSPPKRFMADSKLKRVLVLGS